MDEFFARAQLVKLDMDRIMRDAETAKKRGDLEALKASRERMEVVHEEMIGIRREQLEHYAGVRRKPKRRWLRRRVVNA